MANLNVQKLSRQKTRISFLRQKVCVNCFHGRKKVSINHFCDKKNVCKSILRQKSVRTWFSRQKKCAYIIFTTKKYVKFQFHVQVKIIYAVFVTSLPFCGDITILAQCASCSRGSLNIIHLLVESVGLSGLSRKYPDHPETFQTIRKLSSPPRNFQYNP